MTTQEESPGPDLTQCSHACHATDKLKISASVKGWARVIGRVSHNAAGGPPIANLHVSPADCGAAGASIVAAENQRCLWRKGTKKYSPAQSLPRFLAGH